MIWEKLTKRETEIINLLVGGLKPREIAVDLKISRSTVKHRMNRAFIKAGIDQKRYYPTIRLLWLLHQEGAI